MIRWTFSAPASVIVVAVLFWAASAVICFLQWQRRGRRGAIFAMETLRLLAITALCVALLKPEAVREIPQTQQPHVAIVSDASGSMATRDVELEPGRVVTRAGWLEEKNKADFAASLRMKAKVTAEEFDAPPKEDQTPGETPRAPAELGTNIDSALENVLRRGGNLKAVLLISDGEWNLGKSPVSAATSALGRNIPIFTVGVGNNKYLPDLSLERTTTPAYGLLGEQITIPFKIRSHLPREVRTLVSLNTKGGTEATRAVTIPPFGQVQDSVVWSPGEAGDYTVTLRVPTEPDEALTDNNEQTFRISVKSETLRVLVVDSLPRWEYRYLRNALMRDPGVHVDTLLFHPGMAPGAGTRYLDAFPSSKEELSKYDVVFLGDVGVGDGELKSEDLDLIRGLVEQQGSGLVFLPGMRGRELTLASGPLADLLPIEFDPSQPEGQGLAMESHLNLTTEGKGHLLTMLAADEATNANIWKSLPGFYWSAGVKRNRPGTEVLAVHSSLRNTFGRIPLLVTKSFGNGKVLFMGTDGAWRWRRGVEDKYHYRFWGQVVRWMSHQRHLAQGERVRMSFTPETPATGDTIFLLATVFDASGFPLEKGNVSATVKSPTGTIERLEFASVPGGWGVFKADFIARDSGKYKVSVMPPGGPPLETEIFIARPTREKVGQPANIAVLREIADLTRGAFGTFRDLDKIVQQIAVLPEPKPIEKRFRLWSECWAGAGILLLLGIYWTARKLGGMI